MTFTALRELLDRVAPGQALWHEPHGRTRNASDIAGLLASTAGLDGLVGGTVGVHARLDVELAPLLVLLDGTCRQITLLPPALPADGITEIMRASGSEYLVTTDNDLAGRSAKSILIDVDSLWDDARRGPPDPGTPSRRTRWVLPTSGTTGRPKLVAHTLASLTRSVKDDHARGAHFRWGSLYPMASFAGLQVFFQSWFGGSCLILSGEAGTLPARIRALVASGCNAISATPTMWRKMMMTCPTELLDLRPRQISLGGEIADQKILDALRDAFPTARIAHIFASTEAGVGFAVRDGRSGFPASYLECPPAGTRVAVDDGGHLLLGSDRDEQEYLAGGSLPRGIDGLVDTGDLVRRQDDRYIFLGRADGTINVGGNKVHPAEVEQFLLRRDGVRLARVTRRESPITGSLVQAEVVLDTNLVADEETFRRGLLRECRAGLEPYQVPAILRVVPEIEPSSSGKLQR